MKTLKIRHNFATNSSSSHSLIRLNHLEDLKNYEDNLCFDNSYGWSSFILSSLEEKLRYVSTYYAMHKRPTLEEEELLSTLPPPLSGGIDHQSLDMLSGYTLESLIHLVSEPGVLILGGNDNGGWFSIDNAETLA